tara:strand:+ start:161 stop:568 length:408 start_codon:yes stop_codon:yes gene_type:complete
MSEITTLHKGEFVLVGLVDETIEVTVENNVYSFSEANHLVLELLNALKTINTEKQWSLIKRKWRKGVGGNIKDTDLTTQRLGNLAKLVVDDWDMDTLLSYAYEQVFQNYQYNIDCAVTDAESYDLEDLDKGNGNE